MHSINFSKTGGPEVLKYEKLSISDPKENEVLIKHSAIGLNYIDTYHRSGLYPVPLPSGIGLEGAGIIEKIYDSGVNRKMEVRYTSIDTDVQEMLDAGIHICIAAGNKYYYIAAENDQDWNNYATIGGVNRYYHRGSSPYDTEAFMVGSLDITYTGGKEQKSEFSNCGPGVDIYAPGNNNLNSFTNYINLLLGSLAVVMTTFGS